ncbi:MAG: hypothetical protein V8T36_06450 [Ruthenibacterium lactatiformans]
MDMNYGLPASTMVDTTEFEAKTPYNKYFVEALETAMPFPTNLNGSEFQTMFQKECESLWAAPSRRRNLNSAWMSRRLRF